MGEQQQERRQPGTGKWQLCLCLCRLTFLPCLALLATLPTLLPGALRALRPLLASRRRHLPLFFPSRLSCPSICT
ncbi:hypothetical protein CCHR01_08254 [Colletotrichum chrysophilum]|uniref:Uncharacterized protein n=1 Tax=Colletotrichum chrysophilum TaxID=1836956 RepID=A0AAD9ALS1_9PEZI|nr:hypothetical protein CCHR01_08254 [Colletotrichum chrysophilum]